MIKKIDKLGRVVVPKGLRETLNLNPGDPLDVQVDGEKLTFSPYREGCALCGNSNSTVSFRGKAICRVCIAEIRGLDV
ncbi:MAG: AbrB/MazE/SpoVT family DNA-binding domain-containing protein [Actinomycetota bacterium]|nr:AbrB/MazE/SpoVT family DNA-binding domain-containing protein [Actinomycetota bacterium]